MCDTTGKQATTSVITSRRLSRVKSRGPPAARGNPIEHLGEDRQLAGHCGFDDQPLAAIQHVVEGVGAAGQFA
jgi:hypothetical protein